MELLPSISPSESDHSIIQLITYTDVSNHPYYLSMAPYPVLRKLSKRCDNWKSPPTHMNMDQNLTSRKDSLWFNFNSKIFYPLVILNSETHEVVSQSQYTVTMKLHSKDSQQIEPYSVTCGKGKGNIYWFQGVKIRIGGTVVLNFECNDTTAVKSYVHEIKMNGEYQSDHEEIELDIHNEIDNHETQDEIVTPSKEIKIEEESNTQPTKRRKQSTPQPMEETPTPQPVRVTERRSTSKKAKIPKVDVVDVMEEGPLMVRKPQTQRRSRGRFIGKGDEEEGAAKEGGSPGNETIHATDGPEQITDGTINPHDLIVESKEDEIDNLPAENNSSSKSSSKNNNKNTSSSKNVGKTLQNPVSYYDAVLPAPVETILNPKTRLDRSLPSANHTLSKTPELIIKGDLFEVSVPKSLIIALNDDRYLHSVAVVDYCNAAGSQDRAVEHDVNATKTVTKRSHQKRVSLENDPVPPPTTNILPSHLVQPSVKDMFYELEARCTHLRGHESVMMNLRDLFELLFEDHVLYCQERQALTKRLQQLREEGIPFAEKFSPYYFLRFMIIVAATRNIDLAEVDAGKGTEAVSEVMDTTTEMKELGENQTDRIEAMKEEDNGKEVGGSHSLSRCEEEAVDEIEVGKEEDDEEGEKKKVEEEEQSSSSRGGRGRSHTKGKSRSRRRGEEPVEDDRVEETVHYREGKATPSAGMAQIRAINRHMRQTQLTLKEILDVALKYMDELAHILFY